MSRPPAELTTDEEKATFLAQSLNENEQRERIIAQREPIFRASMVEVEKRKPFESMVRNNV